MLCMPLRVWLVVWCCHIPISPHPEDFHLLVGYILPAAQLQPEVNSSLALTCYKKSWSHICINCKYCRNVVAQSIFFLQYGSLKDSLPPHDGPRNEVVLSQRRYSVWVLSFKKVGTKGIYFAKLLQE